MRDLDLESAFVDAARATDPKTLGDVVRRATDAIDGDGGATQAELCMVGVDHLPDGIGHVHADIAVHVDLADLEHRGCDDLADEIRALKRSPLPRTILERLGCDARITRVLTDGPSQPLDIGRATRTWTAAQRKFILARDGGCVDCGAPPEWCEIHHIHHWEHGGPTNVDNGQAKCRPCHIKTHQQHHRGPP